MRTLDYTGRFDLGYMNGLSLGFSVLHLYHGDLLNAGDQEIPLVFPTDIFDQSYYFFGRGLSVLRKKRDTRLFVFVGATSTSFWAPFLNTARTNSFATAIFYERQISPSLRWFSRNLFSSRQTSIQSLEWAARKDIKMALSTGMGNNQAYGASSFSWSNPRVSVDASYTYAGTVPTCGGKRSSTYGNRSRKYPRRICADQRGSHRREPQQLSCSAGRGDLVTRAAVNGFGIWTGFTGTQLYGSLYQSSTSTYGQSKLMRWARNVISRGGWE